MLKTRKKKNNYRRNDLISKNTKENKTKQKNGTHERKQQQRQTIQLKEISQSILVKENRFKRYQYRI